MKDSRLCVVCNNVDTSYLDRLSIIKKWFMDNNIKIIDININKITNELGLRGSFKHNVFCKYKISDCSKIENINSRQNFLADEVTKLFVIYIHSKNFCRIKALMDLLKGYYPREYKILEKYYIQYKLKGE